MEEQDYIELNTLLAKLRVFCLKSMSEIDKNMNDYNIAISRKEREKNINLVRNIDNIRKQMPLKIGDGTISIIK